LKCSFTGSFSRKQAKIFFRFSIVGLVLGVVLVLHGRVTAPIVGAATEEPARVQPPDPLPSTGYANIDGIIAAAATKYGVDPRLVFYVMRQESQFRLNARSPKDAYGLMQIIPATAERFHVRNPLDPGQNVDGGVRYLRWLLEAFAGDVKLALAGYNAGEGAVRKCGNRVPNIKETQDYVRKISAAYGKSYHPLLSPQQAHVAFCGAPERGE